MGTRKRSNGSGAITTRSRGDGSIVASATEVSTSGALAQRRRVLCEQPILETAERTELRTALDGEADRGLFGFNASTESRVLFVPYTRAADSAEAILLCQRHGFISEKLAQMNETAASITYFTTIIPLPSPS